MSSFGSCAVLLNPFTFIKAMDTFHLGSFVDACVGGTLMLWLLLSTCVAGAYVAWTFIMVIIGSLNSVDDRNQKKLSEGKPMREQKSEGEPMKEQKSSEGESEESEESEESGEGELVEESEK